MLISYLKQQPETSKRGNSKPFIFTNPGGIKNK